MKLTLLAVAALATITSTNPVMAQDVADTGNVGLASTPGGGAPAGDDDNRVDCTVLLGAKVARNTPEGLQAVKLIAPEGTNGAFDIYFPPVDDYEHVLAVGADIGSVHFCPSTPAGDQIMYKINITDGIADIFLPALDEDDDGFQVLISADGQMRPAPYIGEDTLRFN